MNSAAAGLALVLFDSPQAAMRGERALLAAGIAGKLIPTPRQLGADCGLAWRFARADGERVRQALERAGVPYRAIRELG